MHQECIEFNGIQWNSIRIQPNSPNSLLYMEFVSFADVASSMNENDDAVPVALLEKGNNLQPDVT